LDTLSVRLAGYYLALVPIKFRLRCDHLARPIRPNNFVAISGEMVIGGVSREVFTMRAHGSAGAYRLW
jgi:hypothetical protein